VVYLSVGSEYIGEGKRTVPVWSEWPACLPGGICCLYPAGDAVLAVRATAGARIVYCTVATPAE